MNAHELVQTFDCKTPMCTGTARSKRGRYAGLCDVCRGLVVAHERRVRAARSQPDSYEARARNLVGIGRRLDAALAREVPHEELRAAVFAWGEAVYRLTLPRSAPQSDESSDGGRLPVPGRAPVRGAG